MFWIIVDIVFWMVFRKELSELFEVCNKQNVSIHKSLGAAVQVVQREIYCPRMENPCSRENAMNINISSISNLLTCLQNISHIPAITDKTRFQLILSARNQKPQNLVSHLGPDRKQM